MLRCLRCESEVDPAARFCPACGTPVSSVSQLPTAVVTTGSMRRTTAPGGRYDASTTGGALFVPGAVLAERYRIVGLIGRGGMGEVYRADDLKLEQPVALKFLPERLAGNAGMLERFLGEARNARQVAHPNVCRVYDIGEASGHHFISMEYVDGEDLASLLRRIGRLPKAKADEVGRQLCAGLAAAHDRHLLHRDLKPSNVMLDGDGRVRITDFGLAVPGDSEVPAEWAGTVPYMAPEQFEGRPASVQSDLYALGLVLYEIYTGRRPFDAHSLAEWKSQHTSVSPPPPTEVEHEIGDVAERVILRCLEKDPARRPRSALQVAAALPGGDPLAAALAAGETPSPEMVAAAGGEGALAPRPAWTLLAITLALVVTVLALAPASTDLGLAPLAHAPAVMADHAREVVQRLGYTASPRDQAWWLDRDYDPMKLVADRIPSTQWRRDFRAFGPPVLLRYRQSPREMTPVNLLSRVGVNDPPLEYTGMIALILDGSERLRAFTAVPPQRDTSAELAAAPDPRPLFDAAGLDLAAFTPEPPQWVPLVAFDRRLEWRGRARWAPSTDIIVSAAWWRGRPVDFQLYTPESRPNRQTETPPTRARKVGQFVLAALILSMIATAAFFARRNLSAGRGDRRGALRIAGFAVASELAVWALGAHHVADVSAELNLFIGGMAQAFLNAALFGFLYLAVEPYVRRRIPELLVGWARVLDGRFTDPRVGRDVLVGAVSGALLAVVLHLANALPTWTPMPGQTTIPPNADALAGGRLVFAYLLQGTLNALTNAVSVFATFFLLLMLLRRRVVAGVALAILVTMINFGGENFSIEIFGSVLTGVVMAVTVTRFGLLSAVAAFMCFTFLASVPLPLVPGASYAPQTVLLLGLLFAIVIAAFRISLGPRPVFGWSLDD